jgi:hypothetical protein
MVDRKIYYYFLILALFTFHTYMNYHVLAAGKISRFHDEGQRIVRGVQYYKLIFESPGIRMADKLSSIFSFKDSQFHPPLFDLAEAVAWKLLQIFQVKDINLMIVLVNAPFLLLLLFSMYGIGSLLYGRGAGLVSATLVSLFAMVFGHARLAMLDFPAACMGTFAMYALLRTRGFYSYGYSILFGAAVALAVLTKEGVLIFILPPLGYYFFKSWLTGDKKRVSVCFLLTLVIFLLVAGSFFLKPANLGVLKWYSLRTHFTKTFCDPLYYVNNFDVFTGPLILVFTLPFLIAYIFNIRRRDKLIFIWFFVPLVLFSISPSKSIRLPLGILPAFALLVTQEVYRNELLKKIRGVFVFILVFLSVLQYALLNSAILVIKPQMSYLGYGIWSVQDFGWGGILSGLVDVFKKEGEDPANSGKSILFLGTVGTLHWPFYEYAAINGWSSFRFAFPTEGDAFDHAYFQRDYRGQVAAAGYVIDKTGRIEKTPYNEYIVEGLRKDFYACQNQFRLIAQLKAPDGSTVFVYKNLLVSGSGPVGFGSIGPS